MDISLLGGISSNLNTGLQIAKALLGMKVDAAVLAKTTELQGVLASAMGHVIELQTALLAEQARVRELESQVARQAAFDADAGRYELKAVNEGAFAYVLKADAARGEPEHWLCAACFEQRKKSILQYSKADLAAKIYSCPNCATEIRASNPAAGVFIESAGPRRRMFPDY